jgi:hypothetical protein
MSEDRFEQEETQDDDVEAHRRKHLNTEASDELGSDDSDDVEAHRRKGLNDELKESDEGSDDFELHRRKS